MKKLLAIMLMLLPMLTGCNNKKSGQHQTIKEIAQERVKGAVLNSLIDKRDVEFGNITVEFETENIVVLSCRITAYNKFGGMTSNIFEYIYTSAGKERVDNASAGSTPYSGARALAADSVYTKSYKSIVEKELLSLIDFM